MVKNDLLMRFTSRDFLKTLGLHASIWVLSFLINLFLLSNYTLKLKFIFHLQIWSIYLVLFYVFYLLIIPRFFFKKKFILFVILTLFLTFLSYIAKENVRREFFGPRSELHDISQRPSFRDRDIPAEKLIPPFPPGKEFRDGNQSGPSRKMFFPPHFFRGRNLFMNLSGLLLIISIALGVSLYNRWVEDEKIRAESEKEKMLSELKSLKKQVNPHFLFNALNSIYSLANSRSDLTTEAILKLSNILRFMLDDSERNLISLQRELDNIRNYIDLQSFKLTSRTQLDIQIEDPSLEYTIEPLLLMPMVENAFKYGVNNHDNSYVKLYIRIENDNLHFYAENKVVNRKDDEIIAEEGGIGLNNVKRRLELLYGNNSRLDIEDMGDVFKVDLIIEMKK